MAEQQRRPGMPNTGPWIAAGLVLTVWVLAGTGWLAALAAAGSSYPVPSLGAAPVALKQHGLAGLIGPDGSPAVFSLLWALQVVAVAVVVGLVLARRRSGGKTARLQQKLPGMDTRAAREAGARLRPSLSSEDAKQAATGQLARFLGSVDGNGQPVWASLEDSVLSIFGPRSNKTSAVIVPQILAAPGHVVTTSMRPDSYLLTRRARGHLGPVYTLDVAKVAFARPSWWFDPLAGVDSLTSARVVARALMRELGSESQQSGQGNGMYFYTSARDLISQLVLAAAVSERSLRDVVRWISSTSDEPINLLTAAEHERFPDAATAAQLLEDTYGGLADETAASIVGTARTALSSFQSEEIVRWVTPPHTWVGGAPDDVEKLDLWRLIAPPGPEGPITLYLLSKESDPSGRPVMTLLAEQLLTAAQQGAAARGGRLDPPLTLALDEAANTLKLDLPALYSYAGGSGLLVTAVLQSREQGRAAWGREGFEALYSAANHVLIGAGVRDPEFAKHISELVGPYLTHRHSANYARGGGSTGMNETWEQVLRTDEVAGLDKAHAVLLTQGSTPVLLALHPWYREDDAEQIAGDSDSAARDIATAARAELGEHNPLVQALPAESAEGSR